ncbi:peroxiredoxin family protein [Chryseobacterium sp. S90]|uniref:peroxiredoxin family protein n=1 Tax=Chryseobacterium sp. S90 TaxID=3395373 RepID=UPI0039BCB88B
MKKIIILMVGMCILPLYLFGQNNQNFTIQGNSINHAGTMVYLQESSLEKKINRIADSCIINKDGSFILKTSKTGEHLFSLQLSEKPHPKTLIYLINDTNLVTVQLNEVNSNESTITGSPASKELQEYIVKQNVYYSELKALSDVKDDSEKLNAERQKVFSKLSMLFTSALSQASNATVAVYILLSNPELQDKEALAYANQVLKKFPASRELKAYVNNIETTLENDSQKKDLVGQEAPYFSLPDTHGQKAVLQSIKSKYTLVDFWASWCLPCRIENKNQKLLYDEYKDRGFTIIGVSMDTDNQKWLNAVKHDDLPWTQLHESKAFSSDLAKSYHLTSLPSNVLIDQNGTVIAVDIFRDELKNKLNELIR